jgi:hypothetical protein
MDLEIFTVRLMILSAIYQKHLSKEEL